VTYLAAYEADDPFVLQLLANKYPGAMIEVAEPLGSATGAATPGKWVPRLD
jgi:hypothetical protein